jgi:AcrR family transcriptional regulator
MNVMTAKQEQIVRTGKELFWKFGISRVTVEEVCRVAVVSKKTFYKYFTNKTDLVIFILKTVTDEAWERYSNIMKMDIPFEQKARMQIEMKIEGTKDISEEMITDIYKTGDPAIISFMQETTMNTVQRMIGDFTAAQDAGEIRKNVNPQFIMYFMRHMLEMAQDDNLKNLYKTPGELIEELINFFFYGIIDR